MRNSLNIFSVAELYLWWMLWCFYLMAWMVLPSLREGDPFGKVIGFLGGHIRVVSEEGPASKFYS